MSYPRIILSLALLFLGMSVSPMALAAPQLQGQWYQLSPDDAHLPIEALLNTSNLATTPVSKLDLTGGAYLWRGGFTITGAGRFVIDFKNTSIIGQFQHMILSADGSPVAIVSGGLQSTEVNPYFLRNGRGLDLKPGHYRLLTLVSSPLYIGQPQPYIITEAEYLEGIKPGNALVLMCMGVYIGLGLYYLTLGVARRRLADAMYVVFIIGNFFFAATSLLVFKDLLGLQTVYSLSFPILISNMAYIAFVMSLLGIRQGNFPRLYYAGLGILGIMGLFFLWALFAPNLSLELDRYGVALFLSYGLASAIVTARAGNRTAKMYLIAISIFFITGGIAINLSQITTSNFFYIEHMGAIAVTFEVILLALVLAHQFAQLYREKEFMQLHLENSRRMAYTDALTGLPNRYALDQALEDLPPEGSLTFIDIDRLKYYNDKFGHARGDELLCSFASNMSPLLNSRSQMFRVAGDEFAIVCPNGAIESIERAVESATELLHQCGFDQAGASQGSARRDEKASISDIKHLADMRMYEHKRRKFNGTTTPAHN